MPGDDTSQDGTNADSNAEYDAVVYDLDGTLVRLEVNWAACERELTTLLDTAGHTGETLDAWELLETAEDLGVGDEAAEIISAYERDGAENATRLPLADELESRMGPTGVYSLNCEAACRQALQRHDLLDAVDVVIGRDSHPLRKPSPEPLLAVVEALGVDPNRTLFVGDSEEDRVAAERAGTAFRRVSGGHTSRSAGQ